MANAPVNLIFILDWYKYSIYANKQNAPFYNSKVYMHYLIAIEDIMCAAQSIETAAHLLGIGSCYVGSSNSCGEDLIKMYNLPKLTYPVVILSLGYPKENQGQRASKLPYDMVVFDGKYPDLTIDDISRAYESKNEHRLIMLPNDEYILNEKLEILKNALLTTYDEPKVNEIIEQARKDGYINESQRRFGLHYVANEMYEDGKNILEMMKKQGLVPFDAIKKEI